MPRSRPLVALLLLLLAIMLLFSIQRVLFWALNAGTFPAPPLLVFLGGLRFDASAVAWTYLPWMAAMLIAPFARGAFGVVQRVLFHFSNALCFGLNCADMEYFKFTLKRSTADLLGIASGGSDMVHLLPVFLRDYWYIVVIFLLSLALAELSYRWVARARPASTGRWWVWRLALVVIVVVASRGGVQLIPLSVLDASKYGPPEYMPVVLDSPFTVMTSIGKPVLEEKHFMPQEVADSTWPVLHRYGPTGMLPARPNVVVIILESFGAAYSDHLNGHRGGYMPFLDSLMEQGLCYTQAYANGRRSVDGIPAVLASLPKLMDEAFITSPYADAHFTSLPGLLAAEGYSTSFFHGGHNGTMGFDAFARSAGFQRYVGRNEYPDPKDDDGVWGIRDRPFLQFFARQLDHEPQPFMSAVFTLSSHHPYQLPPDDAKRFAGGTLTIHPTLKYADDALRGFFRTASSAPWYRNTLFVITADHTADLERNGEQSGSAYDFWIPLVYYMPGVIAPREDVRTTEQIDILPTVLDMMGYDRPFFAFGSSSLRGERMPAAISEGNATWLMITPRVQLRSDGDHILWHAGIGSSWHPESATVPTVYDLATAHVQLQAAVQQFNAHMIARDLVQHDHP